jgi:hypothetical protein
MSEEISDQCCGVQAPRTGPFVTPDTETNNQWTWE